MQISVSTVVGVLASLSARRAWIEIDAMMEKMPEMVVALRKESVDRNLEYAHAIDADGVVALRKESVDRNTHYAIGIDSMSVALRKESVDRNLWV